MPLPLAADRARPPALGVAAAETATPPQAPSGPDMAAPPQPPALWHDPLFPGPRGHRPGPFPDGSARLPGRNRITPGKASCHGVQTARDPQPCASEKAAFAAAAASKEWFEGNGYQEEPTFPRRAAPVIPTSAAGAAATPLPFSPPC
ncbi:translation initiation factor IF-2-like [Falco biarmicus]|uniref:translation initiation factor IF-2-like n=1 Tax=Falco biarmicus TaxID=345155 RepID=UPI0024BC2D1E|nr:translation initiation factor IF-2-like [Falco biarmicus]